MTDKHNVEAALAALGGGLPKKTGTGPVEAVIESSGSVVEDLGALVEKNTGMTQELLALARKAAFAADKSREAGSEARVLKEQLEAAMKEADVAEIEMDDRDPIAFATTVKKQKTLKSLKGRLSEACKDEDKTKLKEAKAGAEAKAKTIWDEFWGRFPTTSATSLEIPKPHSMEPEAGQ